MDLKLEVEQTHDVFSYRRNKPVTLVYVDATQGWINVQEACYNADCTKPAIYNSNRWNNNNFW